MNWQKENRCAGFTIVELMIALAISAILLGGVVQVYSNSKQTYRTTENVARMQENSRFVMDILTKEIRMAGFSPCPRTNQVAVTLDGGSDEATNFATEAIKGFEGGIGLDATGRDKANDYDVDVFGLNPVFTLGEGFSLNPFIYYMYSDDSTFTAPGGATSTFGQNLFNAADLGFVAEELGLYWIGVNADFTLGPASIWATGIYQGGSVDNNDTFNPAGQDLDVSAYLFAVGASMPLGPVGLHGQFFYASGDEKADDDLEAFFGIGGGGAGWAYYWAEILGLGIFDNQTPPGTPGGDVSNIWAVNLGATLKPIEKLSITGDIWYAQLVEDVVGATVGPTGSLSGGESDLGTEIDLVATYQLVEGLNLDLVGAYLFAGDAISVTGSNDDDPYEVGMRLSLSF